MTPLERAKGRTLKEISGILRRCYSWSSRGIPMADCTWAMSHMVKSYAQGDASKEEECSQLVDWAYHNLCDLEVYMAGRSPGTIAQWSVSHNRRLCEEAERIVRDKAKDRSTLLDYCSHFGIVLDDISGITLKAAFGDGSLREKAYIKKIELTKKRLKEFLQQMIRTGGVNPELSVKELVETL